GTAELGAALAIAAGAVEKIALDVVLLAQTEVGEVAEAAGGGRGGSSTLPHKRNPIGAVVARACAQRARAAAGVLLGAMAHEHERAAGAWHAEWEALRDALALTGGAAGGRAAEPPGPDHRPGGRPAGRPGGGLPRPPQGPRGPGRAPRADGPYSIDDIGGDLLALLDRLAIARASICGVSLGGMVGM